MRGQFVTTLAVMKKTEQVRLPVDLMKDVRSTSSVLGESANDYVARVVREALRKDMPRAAKILTKRAEQAGQEHEHDEE